MRLTGRYRINIKEILLALHNNESHISLADTVQTEQAGADARSRVACCDSRLEHLRDSSYDCCIRGCFSFYNGKFFAAKFPTEEM